MLSKQQIAGLRELLTFDVMVNGHPMQVRAESREAALTMLRTTLPNSQIGPVLPLAGEVVK